MLHFLCVFCIFKTQFSLIKHTFHLFLEKYSTFIAYLKQISTCALLLLHYTDSFWFYYLHCIYHYWTTPSRVRCPYYKQIEITTWALWGFVVSALTSTIITKALLAHTCEDYYRNVMQQNFFVIICCVCQQNKSFINYEIVADRIYALV